MKSMRKPYSIVFSAVLLLVGSAQGAWAQKVYDLGHYPGGTWAGAWGINNSGVVVGWGDIASGYTRPIGVPLLGPNAGQWFDLGTLGGEDTDDHVMCMGITGAGMIVGHTANAAGDIHGFAWTAKSGMVDIGTLAGLGYSGFNFSLAYGVNKAGTLIVGLSGSGWFTADTLPVVWTPTVVSTSSGPRTTWNIQKLDTTGFEADTYWAPQSVNNFGQITGTATGPDGVEISVLWNPVPGGEGWKIAQLPVPTDYPNSSPFDNNDEGEIVGFVVSPDWSTALPALWRKGPPGGNVWSLTVLPTLSGAPQGWNLAAGINDRGDIVGPSTDAAGNFFASRWSTKDPAFVQPLAFPVAQSAGAWSFANWVNDNGIAAGWYGSSTINQNAFAVRFR